MDDDSLKMRELGELQFLYCVVGRCSQLVLSKTGGLRGIIMQKLNAGKIGYMSADNTMKAL